MEYNYDNINEFFDGLNNSVNPKVRKMLVWAGYERDEQRQENEREIEKLFEGYPGYCYNATIITEDIAIVEETKKGETTGFLPCVNKKKSHCIYPTFDEAILAAISIKHTGNEDAAGWMWKLLRE